MNEASRKTNNMLEFLKLKEDHLEMVLNWRTKPEITRYMYTDIEPGIESQKKWFKVISSDESSKHWVIYVDGTPIGLIHLENIDAPNRRTSWGYYIGEEDFRHLGGLIPPYLYQYCFSHLKLRKIVAEVMDGNENIMKIHLLHGYRRVGSLKDHVFKNDRYHDVHLFELLSEDWEKFCKNPGKYQAEFEE